MNYSTPTDQKDRFGGILENPHISRLHRICLDGGKVAGLRRALGALSFESLLDVGCGIGEYAGLQKGRYVGIDNSLRRVAYGKKYFGKDFVAADALKIPFKTGSFEAVLLANTTHHLTDNQVLAGLREMRRVSRKYLILDDAVKTPDQNRLSRYFYSLDRGAMFRTAGELKDLVGRSGLGWVVREGTYLTFPGLYRHAVFVLGLTT